ncbi:protein unc-13 homolog B isoform X3 [Tachysurus ichikawai]
MLGDLCRESHRVIGYAVDVEKSPVDSSRFGSSGNLSQASSQFSSEPEERNDPESQIRPLVTTHPRLSLQELDKGERATRTNSQEPSKENVLPARSESSFKIDSPPIASSRLRWLKAINKVRVHLHQLETSKPVTGLRVDQGVYERSFK